MRIGRGICILGALFAAVQPVGISAGNATERPTTSIDLTNAQANELALELLENFANLSAKDVPRALNELHTVLSEMTLQERRALLQIVGAAQVLLGAQQPRTNQQLLAKFLDDSKNIIEEYNKKNPQ
ncbi:MAG: hypothetical protein A3I44_02590 [Candidatus Sungbacteria bacterium RIFCSPLOWO2_02_FULL_51_17]|uniref:Uncharacterized protein n=1 Tax=Candidatus Sungbacteria bacterium RIFCSPHIGHO2_02_FULL_51_29 TaxID=1802273 RepID=A0A1G2KSR9_9BACT|nr:MAG: hypothetical protein A2676_00210 [Candidatus Sungbacteria bacterium RIFCSPHIGHO2_01_FULL_51_22]OHA02467.1 MAG: hypothetical protein A3C16_05320 [Candidatus Sungbacteria bacterium RIFCSPHIGHO2_02_FULL_51_29]OHA06743.1 MAG: hypothetical protein A3B29_00925 [Candidatus Sungbacteria bacterium RIFCSPLOWO2_01_FULL_51_34]OHA11955.1 MAG: hypothetical protein A3I44_02590 [Candidatus Sungbacteria bacterium RIFCSPLOWO2_02_FULL_51_17]